MYRTHTKAHTHTLEHTHTHAHTYTHTYTHTYAHTRAHTHIHSYIVYIGNTHTLYTYRRRPTYIHNMYIIHMPIYYIHPYGVDSVV